MKTHVRGALVPAFLFALIVVAVAVAFGPDVTGWRNEPTLPPIHGDENEWTNKLIKITPDDFGEYYPPDPRIIGLDHMSPPVRKEPYGRPVTRPGGMPDRLTLNRTRGRGEAEGAAGGNDQRPIRIYVTR